MIIGYLDNSKNNISTDKQRSIVKQYAQDCACAVDVFFCESNICNIISNINAPDATIIIANMACLGTKLSTIAESIRTLISNNFSLTCVDKNLKFDNSEQTHLLLQGLELSIDIRNSMISTITKNALDKKRATGHKLGRDFGSKNKKRIWKGKEAEINQCISAGLSREKTAQKVGISIVSLYNYLRQNSEIQCITGDQNA